MGKVATPNARQLLGSADRLRAPGGAVVAEHGAVLTHGPDVGCIGAPDSAQVGLYRRSLLAPNTTVPLEDGAPFPNGPQRTCIRSPGRCQSLLLRRRIAPAPLIAATKGVIRAHRQRRGRGASQIGSLNCRLPCSLSYCLSAAIYRRHTHRWRNVGSRPAHHARKVLRTAIGIRTDCL